MRSCLQAGKAVWGRGIALARALALVAVCGLLATPGRADDSIEYQAQGEGVKQADGGAEVNEGKTFGVPNHLNLPVSASGSPNGYLLSKALPDGDWAAAVTVNVTAAPQGADAVGKTTPLSALYAVLPTSAGAAPLAALTIHWAPKGGKLFVTSSNSNRRNGGSLPINTEPLTLVWKRKADSITVFARRGNEQPPDKPICTLSGVKSPLYLVWGAPTPDANNVGGMLDVQIVNPDAQNPGSGSKTPSGQATEKTLSPAEQVQAAQAKANLAFDLALPTFLIVAAAVVIAGIGLKRDADKRRKPPHDPTLTRDPLRTLEERLDKVHADVGAVQQKCDTLSSAQKWALENLGLMAADEEGNAALNPSSVLARLDKLEKQSEMPSQQPTAITIDHPLAAELRARIDEIIKSKTALLNQHINRLSNENAFLKEEVGRLTRELDALRKGKTPIPPRSQTNEGAGMASPTPSRQEGQAGKSLAATPNGYANASTSPRTKPPNAAETWSAKYERLLEDLDFYANEAPDTTLRRNADMLRSYYEVLTALQDKYNPYSPDSLEWDDWRFAEVDSMLFQDPVLEQLPWDAEPDARLMQDDILQLVKEGQKQGLDRLKSWGLEPIRGKPGDKVEAHYLELNPQQPWEDTHDPNLDRTFCRNVPGYGGYLYNSKVVRVNYAVFWRYAG